MLTKSWSVAGWNLFVLLAFIGCTDETPPALLVDSGLKEPANDSTSRKDIRHVDDSNGSDGALPTSSVTWSVVDPGTDQWLYGVWGSARDDVWAVGWGSLVDGPTILHYNGTKWEPAAGVPTGKTHVLRAVWGTATNNVWAVGLDGAVFHFTGSSWENIESGTNEHLYGLWGSSANDIWAVGAQGTLIRFNGTKWAPEPSNKGDILYNVWGSSSSDIWAVGETTPPILHYNGSEWTDGNFEELASFAGVWGFSKDDVWIVGWASRIFRYTNKQWTPVDSGLSEPERLSGIWGTSSNNVWIVGEPGIFYCRGGTALATCTAATIPEKIGFRAVWGSSETDIWAVGETNQSSDKVMMHGVGK